MGPAGDTRAVSQVGEACGLLATGARGDGPSGVELVGPDAEEGEGVGRLSAGRVEEVRALGRLGLRESGRGRLAALRKLGRGW